MSTVYTCSQPDVDCIGSRTRKKTKKTNEIKMQLRVTTAKRKEKPEDKKNKRNHIVDVEDDAPLDNIDEISSATTVRPDS